jgi:NADPH:quinone reductase-like Zn-dependent oxidoreductase
MVRGHLQRLATRFHGLCGLLELLSSFLDLRPVAPIIDSVFPLEAAADAHRKLESSLHIGKIVLTTG